MDKLRWGVIGTGTIAEEGARAIALLPDAELVAVGSRTQASADAFADKWGVPNRHASYGSLVNDAEVDVVYVATPHPYHKENAMLALDAGKHVLLEKPFTLNAKAAQEVIDRARSKGLFLMEAMWTRFVPATLKLREMIDQGIIGDVQMLSVNLTFDQPYDLEGRLYKPELGGGALLDLGVYTVSYASLFLGEPSGIQSHMVAAPTGVDQHHAILLNYDDVGAIAQLSSAMRLPSPPEATLIGRKGSIRVHSPFYCPGELTVDVGGAESQAIKIPYVGTGYQYEFAHVHQCLKDGLVESPIMPLDESLQIMQTMDTIRAQWGLTYPGE